MKLPFSAYHEFVWQPVWPFEKRNINERILENKRSTCGKTYNILFCSLRVCDEHKETRIEEIVRSMDYMTNYKSLKIRFPEGLAYHAPYQTPVVTMFYK